MSLIIRFTNHHTDSNQSVINPIDLTIHLRGADIGPFEYLIPITNEELCEIRWYVERSCIYPVLEEKQRVRNAENLLPKLGHKLFQSVFEAFPQAGRLYERMLINREKPDVSSIVIDTLIPEIQNLPWELMADESGFLFSKNPPVTISRRLNIINEYHHVPFELPIHILIITSRPNNLSFIDPRNSAKSLFDTIGSLNNQIEVEILRPPTMRALLERIRNPQLSPVHVLHFDGHGDFNFDTNQSFLCFEDEDHNLDPVSTLRLGNILCESGIPLVILDSCRSGQNDTQTIFSSIAGRLIEAGVGTVIAMNYSLLVETSKHLIGTFYRKMLDGHSIATALDNARLDILSRPTTIRRETWDREEAIVRLHDWFVPVLYQQQREIPVLSVPSYTTFNTGQNNPENKNTALANCIGFPQEPIHQFYGRAQDLLELERLLLEYPITVVNGFGGVGKTAFVREAAFWFVTSKLFKQALFLAFKEGTDLDTVLNHLGHALISDTFEGYTNDKINAIKKALFEIPTLVVWDNLDSVLPDGEAMNSTNSLNELLDIGAELFTHIGSTIPIGFRKSRLLVTTRENLISHMAFQPSRSCTYYELKGLLPVDAFEFANAILKNYRLPVPLKKDLEDLLDLLDGHPLSIQIILPHLKREGNVKFLIDELENLLSSEIVSGNHIAKSLEASLHFSIDHLSKGAKALLPRLAIFKGGTWEPSLLMITNFSERYWDSLKTELIKFGLIRIETILGFGSSYIHFHPTLGPYLKQFIDFDSPITSPNPDEYSFFEINALELMAVDEQDKNETINHLRKSKETLNESFVKIYYSQLTSLVELYSQYPEAVRQMFNFEISNFRSALKLLIQHHDDVYVFEEYKRAFIKLLTVTGQWRERDEIITLINNLPIEERIAENDEENLQLFSNKLEDAHNMLMAGNVIEAIKVVKELQTQIPDEETDISHFLGAKLFTTLALCMVEFRSWAEAGLFFMKSNDMLKSISKETTDAQQNFATNYAGLANVLSMMGKFDEAEKCYETARHWAEQAKDLRQIVVIIGQMGGLELLRGDLHRAREFNLKSLELFESFGEKPALAATYNLLGLIECKLGDLVKAEENYTKALKLWEEMGDHHSYAETCSNISEIKQEKGLFDDAEQWYLSAVNHFKTAGEPLNIAKTYENLSQLYITKKNFLKAETTAKLSLACRNDVGFSGEPWISLILLGEISQINNNDEMAKEYRRNEMRTRMDFESKQIIDTNTAEIREKLSELKFLVLEVCDVALGNWAMVNQLKRDLNSAPREFKGMVSAIWRIVDGERDLVLFDDLDDFSSAVIRKILVELDEDHAAPVMVKMVDFALRGDQELRHKAEEAMRMSISMPNPPEIKTVARVLLQILRGDRNIKLENLPEIWRTPIRLMLERNNFFVETNY